MGKPSPMNDTHWDLARWSLEVRSVEYILINKENIKNNFTPSFDEITDYYNNNSDLFIKEEIVFIQKSSKTIVCWYFCWYF